MKRFIFCLTIIALIVLPSCSSARSAEPNDPELTTSNIENKGSDTIVNLALAWAEAYQGESSYVTISVTGGGSGAGIASLINGTADIANASRKIKDEEIQNAQANGIEPIEYVIARDAIAIIVHLDNPISQLTLQQVSDIYSGKYNNWKELGGDDRPIVRLSRETNSGTHVYFLEEVLRLGESENKTLFATDTLLLPSSEGIIAEIRENPNAIGYDGLGYVTEEMKVVAIATQPGNLYIMPSVETVNDLTYPISRDLYMYTAGEPQGIVQDYLSWILGAEAQEIVRELGFVPILTHTDSSSPSEGNP